MRKLLLVGMLLIVGILMVACTPDEIAMARRGIEAAQTFVDSEEALVAATPDPAVSATPDPAASATPDPAASATPDPAASATPDPAATITVTNPVTPTIFVWGYGRNDKVVTEAENGEDVVMLGSLAEVPDDVNLRWFHLGTTTQNLTDRCLSKQELIELNPAFGVANNYTACPPVP